MYVCVPHEYGALGGQIKVLDPLGLELQTFVSHCVVPGD